MRAFELYESANSFVCYHGTEKDFDEFEVDPHRGIYFATNQRDAEQYGIRVLKCRVTLRNPKVYSEDDSHRGTMEIERTILLKNGYDGRIIDYDNGDKDMIAFHEDQIVILSADVLLEDWHHRGDDGEYIVGGSAVVDPDSAPPVLYHGTNIISAAAIVRDGYIKADEQHEGGYNVCLTSDRVKGEDFAINYIRLNSELEKGAVFAFDGKTVAMTHSLTPFHADTAGDFESEFRLDDDLSLRHCTGVEIVGKTIGLKDEEYMEDLFQAAKDEAHPCHFPFHDFEDFWVALTKLFSLIE